MKKVYQLLSLLLLPLLLISQNKVEYNKDFEFKEGLYLNFSQFLNNAPLPKSAIITDIPKDDFDFFKELLDKDYIVYVDTNRVEQKIPTNKLWGYSKNNSLYIWYEGSFQRINVIGTLCHFTANIVFYSTMMGPGNMMGGVGTIASNQLVQRVLDTRTGSITTFSVESISLLIKSDPELHTEFNALKKRKKQEATFLYLRKFNQRNPLFFPN